MNIVILIMGFFISAMLATGGEASFTNKEEAAEVRKILVGRAIASAMVFIITIVVVTDFQIVIH
jgi:hypothetical protein